MAEIQAMQKQKIPQKDLEHQIQQTMPFAYGYQQNQQPQLIQQPQTQQQQQQYPYQMYQQQIPLMPFMQQQTPGASFSSSQVSQMTMPMPSETSTLYVGDLDEQIQEQILFNYFGKFGRVFSCRVFRDSLTKKSRGFAFISFYNHNDAENARIGANHEKLLGKTIRVMWKKNPQEFSADCNVFVRSIPKDIQVKQMDGFFSQFGTISSSKIALRSNGESLGYGYISFESKDSADRCLEEKEKMLGEHKIVIQEYIQKINRKVKRKAIYVKNLPELSEEEAKQQITDIFSKYGKLQSCFVKMDPAIKKLFALVCFENNSDAEDAFNQILDTDPFNIGENIYINWKVSKAERHKMQQSQNLHTVNETNLFAKNIRQEVKVEQVQRLFSQYGKIQSLCLKTSANESEQQVNQYQFTNSQMAFINFANKDAAKRALLEASSNREIQDLFENRKYYLNYHIAKAQYQNYKQSQINSQQMFGKGKQERQPNAQQQSNLVNMMQQFMMMMQMMFMSGQQNISQFQNQQAFQGRSNQFNNQGNFNNNFQRRNNQPYHRPYQNRNNNFNRNQNNNRSNKFNKLHRPWHNAMIGNNNKQQMRGAASQYQYSDFVNFQFLKLHKSEFVALPLDTQRAVLGEIIYPLIKPLVSDETTTPKVTGMLIDFSVQEIIELIDSPDQLKERVAEAEELIQKSLAL